MNARRWLPFLVVLTPAVLILVWYIQRTFINTVFLDGFFYVPLIDRFLNGNLSIIDLFGRFGEHLLVGYSILSLLNAKFLALDMRLDPIMFLAASAVTAAIVYAECSKIFSNVRLIILGIIFVPLGFLCFSLVAPPLMMMSTQFAWGSAVALLIAWFLQCDFNTSASDTRRPIWPLIAIIILIPLYFLFFSGGYFPGLVLGLGMMYVFRALVTQKWRDDRIVLVAAVGAVCTLLYSYFVFVIPANHERQSMIFQGIIHYFTDPVTTILFYIAGIGSSLVDQHTLEAAPSVVLVVGGVMLGIGAVALWLFVHTKMYLKTYLPVYCLFYPLGILTSVRIGRGIMYDGWGLSTNEWYSFHLRFFVIGVVWILLYVLVDAYTASKPAENA